MSTPLNVLIVEDSENDAVLLARHIKRGDYDIRYTRVDNAESMNTALDELSWDIVISDYSMPSFNGLTALKLFQMKGLDIPFIIVSGTIGEEIAVEAMKAGAHDYVMKGNLTRLIPAIQRELQEAEGRRKRKHAEDALLESEDRYRKLFEDSKDAIYICTVDGKFLDINQAGVDLLGYASKEELLKTNIDQDIYFDQEVRDRTKEIIRTQGFIKDFEQSLKRKDGQLVFVLETTTPVCDSQGNVVIFRGILRDITKQKQLEQQFIQAQKMESIGTLAGGIAHDFNNILGIILGYTNLLKERRDKPKKFMEGIKAINQSVERGAALVNQILTFARKTSVSFEPVNLAFVAKELISMLNQTFPKVIKIQGVFPKRIPDIYADRTQIHQVLLNLCVNARDAMPRGGQITLKTEIRTMDQVKERFPTADQNSYVCLSVSDNGKGMDDATRLRVFDPFFTTKEEGKGMGLGLSVVYGVVQAHHGFVEVESKAGHGTTFRIYFPTLTLKKNILDSVKQKKPSTTNGTETILFVEDEELLSSMVRHILESKGYTIYAAKNGQEALALFKQHRNKIALVLMDLNLSEKTGVEEIEYFKSLNPNIKVVFASGYFEADSKLVLSQAGAKAFIQKPFTLDNFLQTLRSVLDAG